MLTNDYTTADSDHKLPAASLRNRLYAYLLDRVFVLPFSLAMVYVIVYLKSLPLALLCILGDALYKPVLEGLYGYTWGKKLMRLKVVNRTDQAKISWNQSLLRFTPWAVAVYASIFVMVRYFQTPEIMEVTDPQAYVTFMSDHPLSNNFLIGVLNSAWIFACMWIFTDPLRQGLHDKLAKTLVVERPEEEPVGWG